MKKCSDEFEKVIKDYLEQRAEVDELFARKFPNPNKSIEKCCDYIISEVSKSGRCGFSDDEIFNIAVHYYDEENINDVSHINCNVVVNRSIELSEEEKEKARKQAIKDYQEKVVEEMTRKVSSQKKSTEALPNQMELF